MSPYKIILIFSHLPILLTVVYAAVCFKKLGREMKVFSYFVFFSGFIQFTSLFFWFASKNNMPLLHIYVPFGLMMLARFYAVLLKNFINTKIIWFMSLLFFVFSILNSLFLQNMLMFNSNALTIESIFITILALFTFTAFLNNIVKETIGQDIKSLNWVNAGLFTYYSASLLIFYFSNTIAKTFSVDLNLYTWVLHSFFSVVMYTCFLISLWKRHKN